MPIDEQVLRLETRMLPFSFVLNPSVAPYFQITIDNAQQMQVLEGENDLRRVELRLFLVELFTVAQVPKELAALDQLQADVEIRVVFEGEVKTNDEREMQRLQDALLVDDVILLLHLVRTLLVDDLQCHAVGLRQLIVCR